MRKKRGVRSVLNEVLNRTALLLEERFGTGTALTEDGIKDLESALTYEYEHRTNCDILTSLYGHIERYDDAEDEKCLKITKETELIYVKIREVSGKIMVFVTVGTLLGIYDTHSELLWRNEEVLNTFTKFYGHPYASEDPDV